MGIFKKKQTQQPDQSIYIAPRDTRRRGFWHSKFAKIIIIVVIGLVTFVAAAAIFLYLESQGALPSTDTSTAKDPSMEKAIKNAELGLEVSDEASRQVETGGYAAADSWYAKKIATVTDPDAQTTYYLSWTATAMDNGQYKDAVESAQKAEDIAHTSLTAAMLANAAYAANDKVLALKYYKLALERETNWEGNDDVKDTYEQRVKELSQ